MAKKLACRLGRHEWTTRVERGECYKVCAACGKSRRKAVDWWEADLARLSEQERHRLDAHQTSRVGGLDAGDADHGFTG